MIRYALRCAEGHGFDSWFQSADAYDGLRRARMIECPDCGETEVEKALMAPQVQPGRRKAKAPAPETDRPPLASEAEIAVARLRSEIEKTSDYVGMNFAAEARAIHGGTAPRRSIHGEARADEARKLIEDGVPVAPLPFLPRQKSN